MELNGSNFLIIWMAFGMLITAFANKLANPTLSITQSAAIGLMYPIILLVGVFSFITKLTLDFQFAVVCGSAKVDAENGENLDQK